MVAYYAPVDQDGLNQKIFYFHVPIALTAYACFGWGALKAFLHLWKGGDERDLESYVAIHQGVMFALMALVTGSIWAKIAWGHWWEWGDRQLVMFLILFLFYCAYFMLRFSIEPGPQRASISSVYAIFGVVLIPISFLAIRLAESLVHPVAFTREAQMAGRSCDVRRLSRGDADAAYTLYHVELAGGGSTRARGAEAAGVSVRRSGTTAEESKSRRRTGRLRVPARLGAADRGQADAPQPRRRGADAAGA
jgi:heme exporter protein C